MSAIIEKIQQHAVLNPDAIAVNTGDLEISYSCLDKLVNVLAVQLMKSNAKCVGLIADNNLSWVLTDLACLKLNICCVPIADFYTTGQIRHIMDTAGIDTFVGDENVLSVARNIHASYQETILDDELNIRICTARFKTTSSLHEPGTHQSDNVTQSVHAKITFTSGSTGTPKGVCLSHKNIEKTVSALNSVIEPGTSKRHLAVLPLPTLLENVAGMYLALMQGATLVIRSMKDIGFTSLSNLDTRQFFNILNLVRPESIILVPELLRALLAGIHNGQLNPSMFKLIAVGGGTVSAALLQQSELLKLPVVQGYGLSECCSVVTLNKLTDNRPGSAGKPLEHVRIKIADNGEILVAGNLMEGYLDNNSIDSSAIDNEWFATGDLGRVDEDGYLYVTGRSKNLIITSYGKNISPEWLESKFLDSPLVRQVAITGDEQTNLRAIIVPFNPHYSDQVKSLVDEINSTLPGYARIHEYQIALEPFSYENGMLTSNGRLKRNILSRYYPI